MEQNYCESNRPLPSDQFRIPILVAFYTGCKILEANDSSRESTTISRKGARKTGCGFEGQDSGTFRLYSHLHDDNDKDVFSRSFTPHFLFYFDCLIA